MLQHLYDADRRTNTALHDFGNGRVVDLDHCKRGTEFLGPEPDDVLPVFADIAFDVVSWRSDLTAAGYPANVWRHDLLDYEQRAVDRAIAKAKGGAIGDPDDYQPPQPFYDSLKSRLATFHTTHPATVRVVAEGGCGAVEAHVNLATLPAGGQVLVIPTFFYDLCKVQNHNADDARACPNWREAVDGKVTEVAGDYRYQVRWHDGSVRRGTLSFDYNDDGHTITLRKP